MKKPKIAQFNFASKQALKIMKLAILFTVLCTLQSFAHINGQSVTLNSNNTEIVKVLNSIENQGSYRFLYNSKLKDLRNKVSVEFSNLSIDKVLDALFQSTSLNYKVINNNLIAIRSTNPTEQDFRVTGRIVSDAGEPISGASISVKGTTRGTTSDNTGNFAINVPEGATLTISAIGYESQSVVVRKDEVMSIKLVQAVKKIDEVVVIGYGTASKRDLTGSIVKVSGKDVSDRPNTNPVASLQSKVPGLYVVNNGTPGKAPDIRIRGTVSIGQVHPLYIVDGIFNDNIDYLNPNDIESIEILKDPSSLAIFGVKGATGVIAITTKKAKAGQTIISFNSSYGFKKLVDKIDMADANTFTNLFTQENANNNVATPDYSVLTANTDWVDAVTRVGHFNNNSISISGSSENNKFSFGAGYISDEGIVIRERLQKMLMNFNDEFKVNKFIKIGVSLNFSRQHNPYDASNILDNARKVMPQIAAGTKSFRVKNPYGPDTLTQNLYSGLNVALQNSGVVNPVLEVENTWDKTLSYENRYVGSFYTEIGFLKNFTFRPTWYADVSNVDYRRYTPLYYAYNPMTNIPYLYSTSSSVNQTNTDYKKFQQDYLLTFKKMIGSHNLTLLGGFTTYYFGTFGRTALSEQGTGPTDKPIPNDPRFWYIGNYFGYTKEGTTKSNQGEYSTVSEFVRAIYNYKGKYFLNGSFRNDASSQLPADNRNQKFWAVGAAWELSKEAFMQNVSQINFLKLKGSVGVLGNQSVYGVASYYPMYPGLNSGSKTVFGIIPVSGATAAYQPNPDLKWEDVQAKEFGIEMAAFKNRLHFEANYFTKITSNMMTYADRSSLGLGDLLENGGKIKNWGEEFSATWSQPLSKDLMLDLGGNITFMKNKVLSVAADLPAGAIINGYMNNGSAEARTKPGYPIGSFYGYVVDGIYQSKLDVLLSPYAGSLGGYRPGDLKFKDVDGNGVIDANDRTIIGNPSPDFTYGGNVGLKYKRFNVNIDFGGVYGNEIFRTWGSLESPFQRVNYPAFKANSWSAAGTSNWDPIISQGDRFNYNGSTYNIEDGSYFRLRNLILGYDVNPKVISKAKVRSLRFFASVQNIKTWKHNSGYTPEFGQFNDKGATSFGFDFAGGAIPRVTTIGLNVTF